MVIEISGIEVGIGLAKMKKTKSVRSSDIYVIHTHIYWYLYSILFPIDVIGISWVTNFFNENLSTGIMLDSLRKRMNRLEKKNGERELWSLWIRINATLRTMQTIELL